MLNRMGLVALTEHKQMRWRLIRIENWDKKLHETHSRVWFYFLIKPAILQVVLTLNNH